VTKRCFQLLAGIEIHAAVQVGQISEPAVEDRQVGFDETGCSRTTRQESRNGQTTTVYNEAEDVMCDSLYFPNYELEQ
jgi:hypothetical protein